MPVRRIIKIIAWLLGSLCLSEVAEAVRERRRDFPAVGGLLGRVRGGDDGRLSGSWRSPTVRSSTTRRRAAWTAGGAVKTSSKNARPWPASARRGPPGREIEARHISAHGAAVDDRKPGEVRRFRIDAITVSQGSPLASASARITDVLPVPGAPHRSTGTRAGPPSPAPRELSPDVPLVRELWHAAALHGRGALSAPRRRACAARGFESPPGHRLAAVRRGAGACGGRCHRRGRCAGGGRRVRARRVIAQRRVRRHAVPVPARHTCGCAALRAAPDRAVQA